MKFLPISIDTLHEAVLDCLLVEGVMLRDFATWKKGEKQILTFNFEEGHVSEHDDDGGIIKQVDIDIVVRPKS